MADLTSVESIEAEIAAGATGSRKVQLRRQLKKLLLAEHESQDHVRGDGDQLDPLDYMDVSQCCNGYCMQIRSGVSSGVTSLQPKMLFLGSMRLVSTKWQRLQLLSELGVRRVLNVTHEVVGVEADKRFISLRIPVRDRPDADLFSNLSNACSFIDAAISAGESCLVHCRQGASRSATVILAWMVSRLHVNSISVDPCSSSDLSTTNQLESWISLDVAFQRLKQARNVVQPNKGFMEQVAKWYRLQPSCRAVRCFANTLFPQSRAKQKKKKMKKSANESNPYFEVKSAISTYLHAAVSNSFLDQQSPSLFHKGGDCATKTLALTMLQCLEAIFMEFHFTGASGSVSSGVESFEGNRRAGSKVAKLIIDGVAAEISSWNLQTKGNDFGIDTQQYVVKLLRNRLVPGCTWGDLISLFDINVVACSEQNVGSNVATLLNDVSLDETEALELAKILYLGNEWRGLGKLVAASRFRIQDLARTLIDKSDSSKGEPSAGKRKSIDRVDDMFHQLLVKGAACKDSQTAEHAIVMIAESCINGKRKMKRRIVTSKGNASTSNRLATKEERASDTEQEHRVYSSPLDGDDWMRRLILVALRRPRGVKLAERLIKRLKAGKPASMSSRFPEVVKAQKRSKLLWMLRGGHLDLIPDAVEEISSQYSKDDDTKAWILRKLTSSTSGCNGFGPAHPLVQHLLWRWHQDVPLAEVGIEDLEADGTYEKYDLHSWLEWVDDCVLGGSVSVKDNSSKPFLRLADVMLAPESIIFVNTDEGALQAANEIYTSDRIGFDSEWHPLHPEEIALVQIATQKKCFLFDPLALSSPSVWAGILSHFASGGEFVSDEVLSPGVNDAPRGIRQQAKQLVGFGLKSDIAMVNKALKNFRQQSISKRGTALGVGDINLDVAESELLQIKNGVGVFDLEKFGRKGSSLSSMCEDVLGMPLDKRCTISDWHRRPLGAPQRVYAALDAYCCVQILDKISVEENATGKQRKQTTKARAYSVDPKKIKKKHKKKHTHVK